MKKILQKLFDDSIDIKEQLFRNILILGTFSGIVAAVECFVLGNFMKLLFPFVFMFLALGVSIVLTLRYHKIEIASIIIGVTLVVVIIPGVFLGSGGVFGGATIWFVFSIYYMFIMFTGFRLYVGVGLSIASQLVCYLIGYFYPDSIHSLESNFLIYVDSYFSVVVVGIIVSLMMRFQIRTSRKEREIAERQNAELEKARDSRNAFFANVSHEIRTPINSILGLNEMILRENISPEVEEYVKNSNTAGQMLLSLVNDFLDISQIEMKKMTLIKTEYRTKHLFMNVIEVARVLAEEKELELQVDIDERLPLVMIGDQKRVQQILMNLLSNAVKYTYSGSVTLKVSMETKEYRKIPGLESSFDFRKKTQGNENIVLKISVQDTGVGIKKEDLEHLYERFKRFDETKNRITQGTGLGLSITKQLVDLMEGTISVDSIYTKGTVFTVEIEQEVADPTFVGNFKYWKSKENTLYVYERQFVAPEARILIVDDSHINRMVINSLLAPTKVMVDMAKSGEECLQMVKKKYYHVILMDYHLLDMDGVSILKGIRKQENGLCQDSKVILVTASSLTEARRVFQEYRFDGCLEKPVTGKALEEEILKFLPKDVVEYAKEENTYEIKQVITQKHKGIYITSDCVCEIPKEWIEKYDIRLMYLYIQTDTGRFADTKEISSKYMSNFLSVESSKARSVSAPVEEYEEFFADAITESDEVVHISMAKDAGVSYQTAVSAAKGFDHVHVLDSGHISGGAGIVVMAAAKKAMEGATIEEIFATVERVKNRIENRFILPSLRIFYDHGYANSLLARILKSTNGHPILTMKQSRLVVTGMRLGTLEQAKRFFVISHLSHRKKIDTKVVVITHAGCTVKEIEELKQLILSRVPFENVIVEVASVSNACNAGEKSVGIAYLKKNALPDNRYVSASK